MTRNRAGSIGARPPLFQHLRTLSVTVDTTRFSFRTLLSTAENEHVAKRLFTTLLVATAVIKVVAASLVPMTGDEAYFILWGRNPDYGYYDHGPMVGWWLTLFLQVSDAPGWLRLPAVVISLGAAWWLRQALRPHGDARANLAASLFLLSPINLVNIFITTDTPLLAFTILAGITALAADRRGSMGLWWLAGFLLGLGFLSKYLAVILGVAWAVWLVVRPAPRRWGALAMILLGAAIPVAVNIAWNHHHGWTNILFNVMTRNGDAGLKPASPLVYLLLWILLLGPAFAPLLGTGIRRHGLQDSWRLVQRVCGTGPLMMAVVPAVLLGVVSVMQDVGAHWLVAFIPWAALSIAAAAPVVQIARLLKPALLYAAFQVLLLIVGMIAPTDWVSKTRQHTSAVLGVHTEEVLTALAPYRTDYTLASDSYARAALLAYHARTEVPVVGFGSHHGRQDDLLTDFRAFDGKNLMFFSNRPGRVEMARTWFDSVEVKTLTVRGATFNLVLGRGFKFDVYRENVLRNVVERYYTAPRWLTRYSPPADFVERYSFPVLTR